MKKYQKTWLAILIALIVFIEVLRKIFPNEYIEVLFSNMCWYLFLSVLVDVVFSVPDKKIKFNTCIVFFVFCLGCGIVGMMKGWIWLLSPLMIGVVASFEYWIRQASNRFYYFSKH
jgi:hypothetical protein